MLAPTIKPQTAKPFPNLSYSHPSQAELPHIIKFSGGKSSAALTLQMARSGLLDASRGDVVLFANTTAEHSETYKFAVQVCDEVEAMHGIPCLWYEFATVEVASRNGWTRSSTYRLVKRAEASLDDDQSVPGYRKDGTAFEELTSLKRMIPNRKMRFCTQDLKVLPGIELISDWLGGGPGPDLAGHEHGRRLVNPQDAAARYRGTRLSTKEMAGICEFAYSRPWMRPSQRWSDFSNAIPARKSENARPKADLAGKSGPPVRYLTLLGLRADEGKRVRRALFESMLADGAATSSCRHPSHPAGEAIIAPLHDAEWEKRDIEDFWRNEPYNLNIDSKLGNCVYCFMKGETIIRNLAMRERERERERFGSPPGPPKPESIDWWVDIERRYAGKSDEDSSGRFNFLATRSASYVDIISNPKANNGRAKPSLPCACTD